MFNQLIRVHFSIVYCSYPVLKFVYDVSWSHCIEAHSTGLSCRYSHLT